MLSRVKGFSPATVSCSTRVTEGSVVSVRNWVISVPLQLSNSFPMIRFCRLTFPALDPFDPDTTFGFVPPKLNERAGNEPFTGLAAAQEVSVGLVLTYNCVEAKLEVAVVDRANAKAANRYFKESSGSDKCWTNQEPIPKNHSGYAISG